MLKSQNEVLKSLTHRDLAVTRFIARKSFKPSKRSLSGWPKQQPPKGQSDEREWASRLNGRPFGPLFGLKRIAPMGATRRVAIAHDASAASRSPHGGYTWQFHGSVSRFATLSSQIEKSIEAKSPFIGGLSNFASLERPVIQESKLSSSLLRFASGLADQPSDAPKPLLRFLAVTEPPLLPKLRSGKNRRPMALSRETGILSLPLSGLPPTGLRDTAGGLTAETSASLITPMGAQQSRGLDGFAIKRPPRSFAGPLRPISSIRAEQRIELQSSRNYIHVQTTLNNTIITLTDLKGNVLFTVSGGSLGFKNSRKATTYAAQLIGEDIAKKCFQLGIRTVEVKLKGIGYGKESSLRGLSAGGLFIKKIEDVTSLPHNGCRLPKKRRL